MRLKLLRRFLMGTASPLGILVITNPIDPRRVFFVRPIKPEAPADAA